MNTKPSHRGPDENKLKNVSSLFGFQWLFDDVFSICKLSKYYRRATCCFDWHKFDELSDCILEVAGMHLEIGNFVTPELDE